ncbi:MAG TPA: CopD family protein [Acidobacteriota bacterium]|jgi:uncharacterized membrane protein
MSYGAYLILVWLHLLASIIWIGGMMFFVLVLAPYTRRPEQRDIAISLVRWTGMRFRTIGWICIALLVPTGFFTLAFRGFGWRDLASESFWSGSFGQILAIKLSFVALILLFSVLHDFVIGPRASVLAQADPNSPAAARLRRQAAWIGRFNLLVALIIVWFGVMLARGG